MLRSKNVHINIEIGNHPYKDKWVAFVSVKEYVTGTDDICEIESPSLYHCIDGCNNMVRRRVEELLHDCKDCKKLLEQLNQIELPW